MTEIIKTILANYSADNPGTKTNLYRILNHGILAGTGKLVILPVDQGFEHGPLRSFAMNSEAFSPSYLYNLAVESGVNAYAAPLGLLESEVDKFAGQVPIILKLNSNNSLNKTPNQAITGSVSEALRLGCSGIGFTIYPGSKYALGMMEKAAEIIKEAKAYGLVSVIWSYPRGEWISKEGENAIDISCYAAHMAALLGAHIIKVKPPTSFIEQEASKLQIEKNAIDISDISSRVRLVVKSCFDGKRLVLFSGGTSKDKGDILKEIQQIALGGASGSIIGRNIFQRSKVDAIGLLRNIYNIYK